jgi:hypothetical protein
MSAGVPDQLIHEPVGVLIHNSAERIAVEERQNASRHYRAEGAWITTEPVTRAKLAASGQGIRPW